MTRVIRLLLLTVSAALSSSCAFLGLKSTPWPTSVEIHNREAIEFYRSAPPVDENLGSNLSTRPLFADSRLVGMSVSGGGARAAAFTLGVLAELQAIRSPNYPDALDRIDFISSNSGGSWGVAAYLADRAAVRQPTYILQNRQAQIGERFRLASAGRIRCWAQRFNDHITSGATYADVYSAENPVALPRAFFNSSLLPAQSPFVFSDRYLEHYQVATFGACDEERYAATRGISGLPIGFAAATSGSVPGYYSSYADTNLCQPSGRAAQTSFCHDRLSGGVRGSLRLVDGGLYDNIGYKTAFEIFQSQVRESTGSRRSLLIVDSNYETQGQTMSRRRSRGNSPVGVFMAMGFPGQDATFQRLRGPIFRSVGVADIVLLDFFSTANFSREQAALLDGLSELADFASNNVTCFANGREIPPRRKVITERNLQSIEESLRLLEEKGGDCLASNFYRVGTLAKTTYLTDAFYFRLIWQLGQLSVRMNEAKIRSAVF